ncbi:hypothetical protein IE077_001236, partial [Cardiosporidium cionae]
DVYTTVLLLGTNLGAHGLDLSCATHVFILDPLVDPNIEQQVISRAHRMGALRTVHVEVFILKDTIEENILKHRSVWSRLDSAIGGQTPSTNPQCYKKKLSKHVQSKLRKSSVRCTQGGQTHLRKKTKVKIGCGQLNSTANLVGPKLDIQSTSDTSELPEIMDMKQRKNEFLLRTLEAISVSDE